jgi:5-methylcytosine-specific restriction enzyme A
MGRYSSHPRLYNNRRWHLKRKQQLQQHPLCVICADAGRVAASVADHVNPHNGDLDLFWNGPLQSICEHCHNRFKQHVEKHGYSNAVDVDGRPIDPNHPSNSFK